MQSIEGILKDLFKGYFEEYEIKEPSIDGKCGHKLDRMCIFRNCPEFSLHCQNKQCDQSYCKHKLCKNITMDGITELLQQHLASNRKFLERLFDIENAFINELMKKRKEIALKMSFGNLEEKYEKIIEEIYKKGNGEYLHGKEADEFFKKLIFLSKGKNSSDALLQKFAVTVQRASNELTAARETVLREYASALKQGNTSSKSESSLTNSTVSMTNSIKEIPLNGGQIDSVILKKDDPKFKQNLDFIFESLDRPKSLQLLFRGSQHQFLAAKFHEKCDDIPQTFTIIRTEFGKTIAGYNHLKWKKDGAYTQDPEKRCFLLSVDLKQKMTLTDHTKAFQNCIDFGPTFGGGFDIYISNQCDQNNSSRANFPHSYNLASSPYTKSQDSYKAFSGATINNQFKILEYEVFRVVRQ